jgi:cytochrome c-type biogenesis protein CcmH/NrfG
LETAAPCAFCLAAFAIAYLPISNAFPLNATVAEHWLYVPSAFLFLAAAFTLLALAGQKQNLCASAPLRLILAGVLLAWAVFLGVRTFFRQEDWRDQRTFIERTIAAGGDSPRMLMNLANVELAAGQSERALALYREAVRRAPEQPVIALGFAHALLRARDFAGARQALERAETSPLLRAECLQLRAALDHVEHGRDTTGLLRQAAEIAPARWPIRKRHLEHLAERGAAAAARRELALFVGTQPFRAESWKLLGELLEQTSELESARDAYREALRRDVRDEEAKAAELRLRAAGR